MAERQASASQGQTETGQKELLNERYQQGAAMLGSETLAVRLGGIYALQSLAAEGPEEYHLQIMKLLCSFVRKPTKDAELDRPVYSEDQVLTPRIRDDTQAAVLAIGQRSCDRFRIEIANGFTMDLHGANLKGGSLRQCLLDRADLTGANLANADLERASLEGAELTRADISGAKMSGANLPKSIFRLANIRGAIAHEANFVGADLEGTIWYNAELEHACLSFATLKGADLTGANLVGADLSGTVFGKGGRRAEDDIGIYPSEAYTSLIQAQLDQALAAHDCPPEIEFGTTDAVTNVQLVWQNKSVQ